MSELFEKLFPGNFMPHGHCYFWTPQILWMNVISDSIIFISYYSIPVTLLFFARKKRSLPFNWIFWMFAAFILLCGTTHIMAVYTTWSGAYGIEGIIKVFTAVVSVCTAIVLWSVLPKLLTLGSAVDLSDEKKRLEMILQQTAITAAQLQLNRNELMTFTQGAVSREMQMIELKKKINQLSQELGRPEPYDLAFVKEIS